MMEAVYAQAAPGAFDYLNSLIIPTMLIIGIMYFLMIRPQQKRLREHREMIAAIRRGDTVVTGGGIVGKVTKVIGDAELLVELAEGVRVRVVRGTISEVRTRGDVRDVEARRARARDDDDDTDEPDETDQARPSKKAKSPAAVGAGTDGAEKDV
jgi:preprotein translocase subunit YajC